MMIRVLPAPLAIPRPALALLAYAIGASLSAAHLVIYQGRPWALVALLAVPIGGAFVARRPAVTAGAIIGGSLVLMWGYAGIGYADQTDLGRAALQALLAGESPWQAHDLGTHTNPFAYGPLAMLTAWIGPRLELVSALALLGVLAWGGAWLTLGVMAGLPIFVMLPLTGINDYTPALLIVSGLLLLRSHPRWGGVLIGLAAAVKPYAAAWFLMSPWAWVSVVVWLPLLPYAPDFLAMTSRVSSYTGSWLKYLAAPLVLGQPFVSWRTGTLLGAGAFAAVMLFGDWASLGYLVVLIPVVGVALELRHAALTRT